MWWVYTGWQSCYNTGLIIPLIQFRFTERQGKVAGKKNTNTDASTDKVTVKSSLSVDELKDFRELLLSKRRELLRNVTGIQDCALKKNRQDACGDLSMMPVHMADLGTDNYEQEFALDLMDSERKVLFEIDEALTRIENCTYGVCLGTEAMISVARLKAKPWSRYCIEHARELEKKG
ncbi:MAG: TraR/DksA family transcriptional regulator [Phycisphaeraceae bacterium]|nr:TraR/DksA family transcriptional regulator [Phycisphaeraceae bacterium]